MIKTYTELKQLKTFEERFEYLKDTQLIGDPTFGSHRYLNQQFYTSDLWLSIRDEVIIRDNGCDLGMENYDIPNMIIVHHMNNITIDDIVNQTDICINPEYLICVSDNTHRAIHYASEIDNPYILTERKKGDTTPWKLK